MNALHNTILFICLPGTVYLYSQYPSAFTGILFELSGILATFITELAFEFIIRKFQDTRR